MLTSTSENAADILALTDLLRSVSIEGIVTYDEMAKAIGRPIQTRRYLVFAACNRLNQENGALFENVRGVGYKRLATENTAAVGIRARGKIRRAAKLAIRRMSTTISRSNDAQPHVVLAVNRELSVLGLIAAAARNSTSEKTTSDVSEHAPIPVALVAARLVEALR